ncbi:hypothetical protein QE375_002002 [Microbacterium foliorum]|uniref:Uncharacterized protein n=1 Tax=Microbacterium foliorum TaxID=104336 RepID=A0ABU1HS31_9MICO|nr:hypothetical protein [Microbacterium foliorum]MDR6142448.1 hypothetical protein [Microbacterium foliorum]
MNNRPTSRIRRAVAVIAGLAAASVALSGCLYSMIPEQAEPKPSTTNAPDTEGVAEDLLRRSTARRSPGASAARGSTAPR